MNKDTLKDVVLTLRHARLFISTRQKMHKSGIELYDELLEQLNKLLAEQQKMEKKEGKE